MDEATVAVLVQFLGGNTFFAMFCQITQALSHTGLAIFRGETGSRIDLQNIRLLVLIHHHVNTTEVQLGQIERLNSCLHCRDGPVIPFHVIEAAPLGYVPGDSLGIGRGFLGNTGYTATHHEHPVLCYLGDELGDVVVTFTVLPVDINYFMQLSAVVEITPLSVLTWTTNNIRYQVSIGVVVCLFFEGLDIEPCLRAHIVTFTQFPESHLVINLMDSFRCIQYVPGFHVRGTAPTDNQVHRHLRIGLVVTVYNRLVPHLGSNFTAGSAAQLASTNDQYVFH